MGDSSPDSASHYTENITGVDKVYAASGTWRINHLRREILGYLSEKSLIRFLTLNKETWKDAVAIAYSALNAAQLNKLLEIQSSRADVYLSAVNVFDCTYWDTTPSITNNIRRNRPSDIAETMPPEYRDRRLKEVEIYVRTIISICPNLRRLVLNGDYSWPDDHWDFQMTPGVPGGNVSLYAVLLPKSADSASVLDPPSTAFLDSFKLTYGFHLCLRPLDIDDHGHSDVLETWAAILRSDERLSRIGCAVETGNVPVELADIGNICEGQKIETKYGPLTIIDAPGTRAFSLEDFRRFARLASTNLSVLILADGYENRSYSASLTFADLLDLVTIITGSLPHLVQLALSVDGWSEAESICKSCLDSELGRGSIRELILFGPDCELQHFNLIRILARICDEGALLELGHDSRITSSSSQYFAPEDILEDPELIYGTGITWESQFLSYLRAQPPQRQRHSAFADFEALKITNLKEMSKLRSDRDGRPLLRGGIIAHSWPLGDEGLQGRSDNIYSAMTRRVSEFESTLSTFRAVADTDKRSTVLAAAKALYQSMFTMKAVQHNLSQVLQRGMNEELVDYIAEIQELEDEEHSESP